MFETLRSYLLITAAAYTDATGVRSPTIGKMALNDYNFFRRVQAREGFTIKSYDRVQEWLARNWPKETKWPERVPYPFDVAA